MLKKVAMTCFKLILNRLLGVNEGRLQNISSGMYGIRAEVEEQNILNIRQECYMLYHDVRYNGVNIFIMIIRPKLYYKIQ